MTTQTTLRILTDTADRYAFELVTPAGKVTRTFELSFLLGGDYYGGTAYDADGNVLRTTDLLKWDRVDADPERDAMRRQRALWVLAGHLEAGRPVAP